VTGRKESPPLHDSMLLLGREKSLARMDAAGAVLETLAARRGGFE
jgi:hypothetical protein